MHNKSKLIKGDNSKVNTIKRKSGSIVRAVLAMSLSLIILIGAIPVAAAENEDPDPDRAGSISITFKDPKTGKALGSGNKVALYKVADMIIEDGYKFAYCSAFASAGTAPAADEELNPSLAEKMAGIAKDNSVAADVSSKSIDADGKVEFNDLKVGLYLVVQTAKGTGTQAYTINPFLVTIPYRESNGALVYDVNATPKVGIELPPTPPSPPHKPPHLPQTGQLWWPVMVLGAAGVLFVVFGIVRKKRM